MEYEKEFENYVHNCSKSNSYVGVGNPNSNILIIGKEAAIDREKIKNGDPLESKNLQNYTQNAEDWIENTNKNTNANEIEYWDCEKYCLDEKAKNNPLFSFKGVKPLDHSEGQTYRKYQKLHDYIFDKKFDKNEIYNFQENFFITELNDSPNKRTKDANKDSLKFRKELFKNEMFIQSFKVVILASSNYISNVGEVEEREIDNIFKVHFVKECGAKSYPKQKFWVHKNESGSKLVIHTRQLSTNVSDELLENIAKEVREHLKIN